VRRSETHHPPNVDPRAPHPEGRRRGLGLPVCAAWVWVFKQPQLFPQFTLNKIMAGFQDDDHGP